jgi:hypothetical protein
MNAKVLRDRRGTGVDRRAVCPQCGSPMSHDIKKTTTGSRTTLFCTRCEYKTASEQMDVDQLLAKLTWVLELEKRGPMHHLAFPQELMQALGLAEGDHLVLKPLTSTLGSLDMRWMLEVKKRRARA